MAENQIPGFNPNRSNNYVLRPDAPTKQGGAGGSGGNTGGTGGGGTTPPATEGSFFSLTGPGWSGPTGQQVSDWATVAGSNQPYAEAYSRATGQQTPADIVKMRADVEAARQRLGHVGSATADFAGTTLNPTNLLTRVPYVGPGLAGAAQQGFADYGQGKDWPTIGKDAALGFGAGEASLGLVQPKVAQQAAARAVDVGGGWGAGTLLGHGWGSEYTVPGMLGAGAVLHKGAEWVGDRAGQALNNPTVQRAVQQLLYGGMGAAKDARDYGNWIPGQ